MAENNGEHVDGTHCVHCPAHLRDHCPGLTNSRQYQPSTANSMAAVLEASGPLDFRSSFRSAAAVRESVAIEDISSLLALLRAQEIDDSASESDSSASDDFDEMPILIPHDYDSGPSITLRTTYADSLTVNTAETFECAICRERHDSGHKTTCGHLFDVVCLQDWVRISEPQEGFKCPTCRASLVANDIITEPDAANTVETPTATTQSASTASRYTLTSNVTNVRFYVAQVDGPHPQVYFGSTNNIQAREYIGTGDRALALADGNPLSELRGTEVSLDDDEEEEGMLDDVEDSGAA
ncbi:uncharacterized protein MYCGRDRAFT_89718 [Zymoseptoria tritici IPO323]|uniref:RING-type domain-containing protein n=1 Tax=Zymoseptoria tritici (strain CBS 115943 / IPO323) TaxID=336722 RepID=F9X1A2_ZYMTI|nr:uncharacterized protein MYCGRDRAFT_89718 [Zymoseptoria tritici IPO323]EGP92158.1 hypothetical protein MYCGRDRAFT_89718 [Zymoseptoria tritici IPO323]